MSVCYIVGAGDFGDGAPEKKTGDLLIACDGGYRYCLERDLTPDILIGDMDSLGYTPSGRETVLLPREKDVTDMKAACDLGYEKGYRSFVIYGGTGGSRISHTVANLQLMAEAAEAGCQVRLHGNGCRLWTLRNGRITFPEGCGGYLSIFSLSPVSEGVTSSGLKYELHDRTLSSQFPLGVSNEFSGGCARISVARGILLVIRESSPQNLAIEPEVVYNIT